jgi:hypothetical protein
MKTYVFILKHDNGEVRIKTAARNLDAAKTIISQAEGFPLSALDACPWFIQSSKKELLRTKQWLASM